MSVQIRVELYITRYKDKIKDDLKEYFLGKNIIIEKDQDSLENTRMFVRSVSQENLYFLYLKVKEDDSEKALELLDNWINEDNGVQMHKPPCIVQ